MLAARAPFQLEFAWSVGDPFAPPSASLQDAVGFLSSALVELCLAPSKEHWRLQEVSGGRSFGISWRHPTLPSVRWVLVGEDEALEAHVDAELHEHGARRRHACRLGVLKLECLVPPVAALEELQERFTGDDWIFVRSIVRPFDEEDSRNHVFAARHPSGAITYADCRLLPSTETFGAARLLEIAPISLLDPAVTEWPGEGREMRCNLSLALIDIVADVREREEPEEISEPEVRPYG